MTGDTKPPISKRRIIGAAAASMAAGVTSKGVEVQAPDGGAPIHVPAHLVKQMLPDAKLPAKRSKRTRHQKNRSGKLRQAKASRKRNR